MRHFRFLPKGEEWGRVNPVLSLNGRWAVHQSFTILVL